MFKVGDTAEFKSIKSKKWLPCTVTAWDEVSHAYTIKRPSGEVVTGLGESMLREPKAAAPSKTKETSKKKTRGKGINLKAATKTEEPASVEFHRDLQRAYDHFNNTLFDGKLPGCFWTTIQKRSVLAYFKANAWVQGGGGNGIRDEIMINPDYLPIIGIEDFLSSIAHEQAHQYQTHFGEDRPRPGYHNEEFAQIMSDIGLICSNTGSEGGKKVGQRMNHYILPEGGFRRECAKLLKGGFELSWTGAVAELHGHGPEYVAPIAGKTEGVGEKPAKKKATRAKFVCSEKGCKENAMARPNAQLACGIHMKEMVAS